MVLNKSSISEFEVMFDLLIKNRSDSSRESILKIARLRKGKSPPILASLYISLEYFLMYSNREKDQHFLTLMHTFLNEMKKLISNKEEKGIMTQHLQQVFERTVCLRSKVRNESSTQYECLCLMVE